MAFKNLIIAFMLTGLFLFAMFTFGVQIASQNGVNQSIGDSPQLSGVNQSVFANLQTVETQSQLQRESFEKDTPTLGIGALLFGSLIGAGKAFTGSLVGMSSIIFGVGADALGIPSVVLGTITAILLISIIFLAWRLYKAGE